MIVLRLSILAALLTTGLTSAPEGAVGVATVWIDSPKDKDHGQGFFAASKGICLIVTAAHIVIDGNFIRKDGIVVRWSGSADLPMKALWTPTSLQYDVAYLDPERSQDRPSTGNCPNILPTVQETDVALKAGNGVIISTAEDGDRTSIPVEVIKSDGRIVVKALALNNLIQKGLSGAPFVINGNPYGVVYGVSEAGAEIYIARLDSMPKPCILRRDCEGPETGTGNGLGERYLSKLDDDGRLAYRKCEGGNFEMCNLFGSALITYGLTKTDPWTQDAAAPFFALACDHEVPWACSNLALIFKNGGVEFKRSFSLAAKYYDRDCNGHGDPAKVIKKACEWRDALQ